MEIDPGKLADAFREQVIDSDPSSFCNFCQEMAEVDPELFEIKRISGCILWQNAAINNLIGQLTDAELLDYLQEAGKNEICTKKYYMNQMYVIFSYLTKHNRIEEFKRLIMNVE